MKRLSYHVVMASLILCAVLAMGLCACTPLPDLSDMKADLRDNPADPDKVDSAGKSWKVVGNAAVASGTGTRVSLAVDAGIPYVAFAQGMTVKTLKFSSGTWSNVSSANLTATFNIAELAFTVNTGVPYVVYRPSTMTPMCLYLSGSNWLSLDGVGFAMLGMTPTFSDAKIEINGSIFYMAYKDTGVGYVARYDGTLWTTYPFADGTIDPTAISLAVNGGKPYISFSNHYAGVDGAASVRTPATTAWPPTAWEYLFNGINTYLSSPSMEETSIAFIGNVPYVASMITGSVTVKKYLSAAAWSNVGSGNIVNNGQLNKLATDAVGNIYIAYKDTADGSKITVRKFDGTAWVTVGTAGFSGAVGNYLDFAISQTDGTLYVAYENADNTNQVQVMKFD